MIIGAHSIIYSKDPDADRAFLRDVVRLSNVDAGEGWLIFGLPPSEVAVHPSDKNDVHEFYLMCDDVQALVAAMNARGIVCGPVHSLGWGALTQIMLPGGGKLGVYQPRHARPRAMTVRKPAKKATAKRATKGAAARKTATGRLAKAKSSVKAKRPAKARSSAKAGRPAGKSAKATAKRSSAPSSKRARTR
jgi:hypothetical protein